MTTDLRALSYEEKFKLAKNPNTPIEILQVLATDDFSCVRSEVARNSNTPVETLQVLSTGFKNSKIVK